MTMSRASMRAWAFPLDCTLTSPVADTSPCTVPSMRTSPSTVSVPISMSRGPSTTVLGVSGWGGVAAPRRPRPRLDVDVPMSLVSIAAPSLRLGGLRCP